MRRCLLGSPNSWIAEAIHERGRCEPEQSRGAFYWLPTGHAALNAGAQRLAQLAKDRQVIVFTHDVAFVGDLSAVADSEGVPVAGRSVERQGLEPGACLDFLPWKAKDFGSRIDHLCTELVKPTKEWSSLMQDHYQERVALWAGKLSEAWERCVTSEILYQVPIEVGRLCRCRSSACTPR